MNAIMLLILLLLLLLLLLSWLVGDGVKCRCVSQERLEGYRSGTNNTIVQVQVRVLVHDTMAHNGSQERADLVYLADIADIAMKQMKPG